MTTTLRLSSLAPPPVPLFFTPRPGTLPASLANSGESPGFSLDLARIQPIRETRQNSKANFSDLMGGLAKCLESNHAMRAHAASLPQPMKVGSTLTETAGLTSAQKADLAFHLMLQIRNKLMDAYREIQQIQI